MSIEKQFPCKCQPPVPFHPHPGLTSHSPGPSLWLVGRAGAISLSVTEGAQNMYQNMVLGVPGPQISNKNRQR